MTPRRPLGPATGRWARPGPVLSQEPGRTEGESLSGSQIGKTDPYVEGVG